MKVFGTGLPRTGTASASMAMLDLGFKTCHCCWDDRLYERAEAFFDTPIWADYQALDTRFPGSKFIHLRRDLEPWCASVQKTLGAFVRNLAAPGPENARREIDRRSWLSVFETFDLDGAHLKARYRQHEERLIHYFRDRPKDLLVINVTASPPPWEQLADFLNRPLLERKFPHLNAGSPLDWHSVQHPGKMPSVL